MPDSLSSLLTEYRKAVAQILGNRLNRMVLYGSYARGDFKQDSDIDIMVLADICPEEVSSYADKIYDITYDFELQYGIEINPSIQSIKTYEQWKNVYLFFMNIEKDGVII